MHRSNTTRCKVCCTLHRQVKVGVFLVVYFRLIKAFSLQVELQM
jgi:hypothetical protein